MKAPHAACALGLLGLLVGLAPAAHAKSNKRLGYRFDTVWSSAVRLIRVDRGYTLKDKDKENGFILFVFPGSGAVKACPASMELVRVRGQSGEPLIQVQLNIAHQPSYVEIHLLDTLERKLQQEQGPPPPYTPGKRPSDKDRGKDGKDGKGKSGAKRTTTMQQPLPVGVDEFPASSLPSSFVNSWLATHAASI